MTDPIPDEPQLRLVANTVVVHPETGRPITLYEGDRPPAWARGLIGPHLFGYTRPRPTGPVTDMKHESARDQHGRPNFIDVVCIGRPNKPHGRVDLARFETTVFTGYSPGRSDDDAAGWAAREIWEWDLTFDPALRPAEITASAAAGDVAGRRAVRLRCRADDGCPLDLDRHWREWESYLNAQRHTGSAEVDLYRAIRELT